MLALAKVLMFDPPSGWQYGFPKPIPQKCLDDDTEFKRYLVQNGYPDHMLDMAFKYSRYWEASDEDQEG